MLEYMFSDISWELWVFSTAQLVVVVVNQNMFVSIAIDSAIDILLALMI